MHALQLSADEHYENAEMAFAMESFDKARASFKRALDMEPEVRRPERRRCPPALPPSPLCHCCCRCPSFGGTLALPACHCGLSR